MKEIDLTIGSIFGKLIKFSLPISLILTIISLGTRVVLSYALAPTTPLGVIAIWLSISIGWVLADVVGYLYYKKSH